jgi:hypothetical protein
MYHPTQEQEMNGAQKEVGDRLPWLSLCGNAQDVMVLRDPKRQSLVQPGHMALAPGKPLEAPRERFM